jgi:NAD(P)H dehydrogenase (quinone)
MPPNILIINSHPSEDKLGTLLHNAYKKGALEAGFSVNELFLRDLLFNLNLEHGYKHLPQLEPDLLNAQTCIAHAGHIVFIYPVWWGTYPALLKGFIDRVFLPGFGFRFHANSEPEKLLAGKSARLLVSMDSPLNYHRNILGSPGEKALKLATLEFCGIHPVKVSYFPETRRTSIAQLKSLLHKVELLGRKGL